MNHTPEAVAPTPPVARCGWCESTHIAEITCTCKTPCAQGWCPAALTLTANPDPKDPT